MASSAYLRLLIFLWAILIQAWASSSLAFCMMYSAVVRVKEAKLKRGQYWRSVRRGCQSSLSNPGLNSGSSPSADRHVKAVVSLTIAKELRDYWFLLTVLKPLLTHSGPCHLKVTSTAQRHLPVLPRLPPDTTEMEMKECFFLLSSCSLLLVRSIGQIFVELLVSKGVREDDFVHLQLPYKGEQWRAGMKLRASRPVTGTSENVFLTSFLEI